VQDMHASQLLIDEDMSISIVDQKVRLVTPYYGPSLLGTTGSIKASVPQRRVSRS